MGLRLFADGQTLGGLNLYSTEGESIDPEVRQVAELLAAHAALALGRARREEGLSSALTNRRVIGQAIGIVMERYQMDEDRAFQYLVRVSQHSNIKLRDVARELVDQGNHRTPDAG
ncbi:ANTAR domain-containing protein [Nocardioides pakistanensis]